MKRHSLRFRLLILCAAAVTVPAVVISLFQRRIGSDALKRAIEQEQTQLARRIATGVDNEIHHAQSLVALVAGSSSFSAGSRVDQYEALHNLLTQNPAFQEAMFVNAAGDELMKVNQAGTRPSLLHRTENVRERFIGAPFFSGNRSPTILIGEPVRSFYNPLRQGAIFAKMSFTTLGALMRQANVGPRGEAFVVNERGTLLAHPDDKQVFAHANLARTPVVQDWIAHPAEPTRLQEYIGANGQPMMALAYPIPLLKSAVIVQQPKADVYAPLEHMRNQVILWTLVSLLVFISLAVAVALRILDPLRRLRLATEEVGSGQRDLHLDIHTHDELEELGTAFERMTHSLAELERMRSDLINMVVHDLKMPLATILPSLDCLLTGELGRLTSEQLHFVQMSRRSGHEMLMLIQNLLDVAKIEEGKMNLHRELFVPGDWAESVIANFQPLAAAGKKQLKFVESKQIGTVEGDVALLSRALGNLISNALRHTVAGQGEVTVTIYREGNQLAVQVSDNGEGIPEEDQQRIFDKFVQGSKRMPVRTGTGLGLTFCKLVIEAHGGRITVSSIAKEGTQFTFHLPLQNPAPLPVEEPEKDLSTAG